MNPAKGLHHVRCPNRPKMSEEDRQCLAIARRYKSSLTSLLSLKHDATEQLVAAPDATVRIRHVIPEYPDPEAGHLLPGQPLRLRIGYEATGLIDDVAFALEIFDERGTRLMGTTTDVLEQYIHAVDGEGEVVFAFEQIPLLDGRFPLTVAIHSHDGGKVYDEREYQDAIVVMNPSRTRGIVHFPAKVEHIFDF